MCSSEGRHADALGHQAGQHLGREGAAGARHLGRARLGGVHVLVRRDRVAAAGRSRSGWGARGGPGSCAAARASRPRRDPQPHAVATGAGGVGGEQGDVAAVGQGDGVARAPRSRWAVAVAPDLDGPQAGRQLGREVHLRRRAVGAPCRRARPASVPEVLIDDQVALVEEAGQLGEVRVHERAVGPGGHQHAHGVTRHAPVLGRRRRLELGRQREGERVQLGQAGRGHGVRARGAARAVMPPLRRTQLGGAVAAARAMRCRSARGRRARRWPARAGPRCPRRGRRPGAWRCAGRRGRPTTR